MVGLEPVQCPTLFCNGYGAHDIQGIGDKHVTWIHNTDKMDAVMCIDEWDCKLGLQLFTEPAGQAALRRDGIEPELVATLAQDFGIWSVCNLLGAIKTAKHYRLGARDAVFTIATDGRDRYPSVLETARGRRGALDESHAAKRLETIFHMADTDWIREGTPSHARLLGESEVLHLGRAAGEKTWRSWKRSVPIPGGETRPPSRRTRTGACGRRAGGRRELRVGHRDHGRHRRDARPPVRRAARPPARRGAAPFH